MLVAVPPVTIGREEGGVQWSRVVRAGGGSVTTSRARDPRSPPRRQPPLGPIAGGAVSTPGRQRPTPSPRGPGLEPAVAHEIQRVQPAGGQVHLLGGVSAISPAVEADVVAPGYMVLTGGDALPAETAAGLAGGPVLLSYPDELPAPVATIVAPG